MRQAGDRRVRRGLFITMSTSKIVIGVAATLAVAGIGMAVLEFRAVGRASSALAVVSRERDSLRARVTRLEEQPREVGRVPETALPRGTTSARSRPSTAGRRDGSFAWESIPPALFGNPEFVSLLLRQYRAKLGIDFAPLYRQLGLSPDQVARFEEHMVAAQAAICQVLTAAHATGTEGTDPDVLEVAGEKQGEAFRQLHEMLGDAGFRQFQLYLLSQVAIRGPSPRDLLVSMAGDLSLAGAPLSTEQSDQLLQLVTDHRRVGRRGNPAMPQGAIDWAAVDAGAKGLLSATQLAAFQAVRERYQLDRQVKLRTDEAARDAAPGGG